MRYHRYKFFSTDYVSLAGLKRSLPVSSIIVKKKDTWYLLWNQMPYKADDLKQRLQFYQGLAGAAVEVEEVEAHFCDFLLGGEDFKEADAAEAKGGL